MTSTVLAAHHILHVLRLLQEHNGVDDVIVLQVIQEVLHMVLLQMLLKIIHALKLIVGSEEDVVVHGLQSGVPQWLDGMLGNLQQY